LFAALIKKGVTADLLFNKKLELYTPFFVFEEFKKYEREILNKTHRTPLDFQKFFISINESLNIIPSKELKGFVRDAEELTPDPLDMFCESARCTPLIYTNQQPSSNILF